MLYAKISPAAQVVKQNGPFDTNITSADYMTASVNRYVMGISDAELTVSYGTPVYDEAGKLLGCNFLLGEQLKLTKEELADWGTDDAYIFNLIASKKGLTIVEIIDTTAN